MSPSYCPHCGAPLAQRELDARPGLRRVPDDAGNVHRFRLGDGAAETGATWQEFRRPAREANVASDVATPALQSLVTAAAAAFVSIVPVVATSTSVAPARKRSMTRCICTSASQNRRRLRPNPNPPDPSLA